MIFVLFLLLLSLVIDCHEGYTHLSCELKPRIRASRSHLDTTVSSGNWSGYVAAPNLLKPTFYTVTQVTGSWIVPNIVSASVNTSCSIWVGIDGAGSPSVEQLGTEHDWTDGHETHYAWYEMFPAGSNEIVGFPVEVGDFITASVSYSTLNGIIPIVNGLFILEIMNHTKKVYSVIPRLSPAILERVCAEWVVEAPWLNQTLPLSDFGKIYMSECSAEITGILGAINNPAWSCEAMNMVAQDGTSKSIVSALSPDGSSFSVQWFHV